MRRLLTGLFLLIICMSSYAATIKDMVFFGDSLSDNGNLYSATFKLVPKSPPYYAGRFSNGPTWAEHVSDYFEKKRGFSTTNYAVGSATSVFHWPSSKAIALSTLGLQINEYILASVFHDKSETLYTIWVGANDYLNDTNSDEDALSTQVVDNIKWALNKLKDKGATRFLILNLPDLSLTPRAQASSAELRAHYSQLVQLHNAKLKAFVDSINDGADAKVAFIDVYSLLNAVIADPAPFNEKYGLHITDTKTPCWGGGYTLQTQLAQVSIEKQLRLTMKEENGSIPANVDFAALSEAIQHTPALQTAYETALLSQAGMESCVNPNQHVFWDKIHPTQPTHYVLGQIAIDTLLKMNMFS